MVRVKLLTPGGMRYKEARYNQGDSFSVSDEFLAAHPTRLELLETQKPKRKRRTRAEMLADAQCETAEDEAEKTG